MRNSYLLFIIAAFCISAVIYMAARPPTLSPATERAIHAAVAEAVAAELHQNDLDVQNTPPSSPLDSELQATIRGMVGEAVEAKVEKIRQAAEAETQRSTEDAALHATRQEAERRLRNVRKALQDGLVTDALRIASDVQAWKLKPAPFGGGQNHDGFTGLTFDHIGIPQEPDGIYKNLNGTFEIDAGPEKARIIGTNDEHRIQVVVTLTGTGPHDLSTEVITLRPGE